jgi:hypothetical protein
VFDWSAAAGWAPAGQLIAADAAYSDLFGLAVGICGDTIVVGALHADCAGKEHAGAAYVFVRSGDTWVQEAKLTASDPTVGAEFAGAVAVDADTAVIGASETAAAHGAAYVFVRSDGVWRQQAKLAAADSWPVQRLGCSVALSGDTALIGAYNASPEGVQGAGAAYVFTRSGEIWTQDARLTAGDPAIQDDFGFAVSLDGETALIGARRDDQPGLNDTGAAYVFGRANGAWVQQAKLTASDPAAGDWFGSSASVCGDVAVVGAYNPGEVADRGAAYFFSRSAGAWSQRAKLTSPAGQIGDRFGYAVTLDRDVAVVGASETDVSGFDNAGAAYAFDLLCEFGDMNCDGHVDFDDINPFVTALVSHAQYVARYPGCRSENADCNQDGHVDFDDINPFVACLVAGRCP